MKTKLFIPFLHITSVVIFLTAASLNVTAQDQIALKKLPNEYWYGGHVADAYQMPLTAGYQANQRADNRGNQVQPLYLSSKGRYIWCEDPMRILVTEDSILVSTDFSEIVFGSAGNTLKEAYLHCSKTFFPPTGQIPDELLFTSPQYNTWIELMYDQNEADILDYARQIVDNGFPPGVLMIDDNWQENYGIWEFKAEKFDDPKAMVEKLHSMGFKVMLWVCPFISPDSENFRMLRDKGYLLKNAEDGVEPAIIKWWNGYSAHLDFTNPEAVQWFKDQLDYLQETYGVDGFKLDAGDFNHYAQQPISTFKKISHVNKLSRLYAEIGLDYPLNEYRACWKLGGEALAQRLRDKDFSWEAARTLVPGITIQGILGYPYACPDMIGGGEYKSFLSLNSIDQEMIVRSAQAHALMPMMQFSVAPWRILDEKHLEACRKAAWLHKTFGDEILQLTKHAANTGEPIARLMDYEFPGQDFELIHDQFMLGENILVAPLLEKGKTGRKVVLPEGKWKSDTGEIYKGGKTIDIAVKLDRLPYFELLGKM